jgi:hypothetical protein
MRAREGQVQDQEAQAKASPAAFIFIKMAPALIRAKLLLMAYCNPIATIRMEMTVLMLVRALTRPSRAMGAIVVN